MKEHNKNGVCYFNICITNGKYTVAFRYCTSSKAQPETMYFFEDTVTKQVIITSEKLSSKGIKWIAIPRNACLLVDTSYNTSLQELPY